MLPHPEPVGHGAACIDGLAWVSHPAPRVSTLGPQGPPVIRKRVPCGPVGIEVPLGEPWSLVPTPHQASPQKKVD